MQEKKNYVGIDLSKRNLIAVRILSDGRLQWFRSKTNAIGREKLLNWLKYNDLVGLETGNLAFFLAKEIINELGVKVIVLNAGDVAVIYRSLKKTDKEDSLKIARLLQRHPLNELPSVRIPDAYEEHARQLLSEHNYWTTSKTRAINRLHSILCNAGLTTVTKKDIKNSETRLKIIKGLNESTKKIAMRIESEIVLTKSMLEKIEVETQEHISKKNELAKIIMSIPGIGLITTLAILGYLGDPGRFSSEKQVSYFVGLVPRIDNSGDTERMGRIIKRGCRHIRRTIIQCAWALVRSKYGGDLKIKFEKIKSRRGSGKAIVAVARKLIERVYHLLRKQELYKYMPEEFIIKKMAFYKI
jgi:transposase